MNAVLRFLLPFVLCFTLLSAAYSQQPDLDILSERLGIPLIKYSSLNNAWQEGSEPLFAIEDKRGKTHIYNASRDLFWPEVYEKVILPNMGYSPASFTILTSRGMWEVYAEHPAIPSEPWSRLGEIPASEADSIAMTNFGEYIVFSGKNLCFLKMSNGRLQQVASLENQKLIRHITGEMIFTKSTTAEGAPIQMRDCADGALLSKIEIDSVWVYPTAFSDHAVFETSGQISVWDVAKDSLLLEGVLKAEPVPMYEFPLVWGDGYLVFAGHHWLHLPIDNVVEINYKIFGDYVSASIFTAEKEKVVVDLWNAKVIERSSFELDTFVVSSMPMARQFSSELKHLAINVDRQHEVLSMLGSMQQLASLTISGGGLSELYDVICQLKTIKHLDISATGLEELPMCVFELANLETLNVEGLLLPFSADALTPMVNLRELHVSTTENPDFTHKKVKSVLPLCKVID